MNKVLHSAAGAATAAGALAVAWVAAGHLNGNPLALGMTLLIGAFYAWGVLELWRFHQATLGLQQALQVLEGPGAETPPERLHDWLARVPAALRGAVRQRVQDERGVLPGPALTPYLAGLLVLLGMLGTFLGMVVTLNGTGLALERASDVQTMRDSLAAPVRGLGLAFGTSVAGVAASAMLGLVSALCRRARAGVAMSLDGHIAGALQVYTRAHQRRLQLAEQQARQHAEHQASLQAALALQQQQAAQLPLLVASLQALATSVGQSLQDSLAEGARLAAGTLATLQPTVQTTVQATMSGITRETAALHGHIAAAVQQQLDGLAQRLEAQAAATVAGLGTQAQAQTTALLQALGETQARQQASQRASDEARQAAFSRSLADVATRLEQSSTALATQLAAQARQTIDEVARLARTAGEAPRAAAEVVAQLRDKLSASLAQDNSLLEERSRIMATLNTLLGAVQHTSTAQKAAIDELVASSARWLQEAGARFTEKADAETARLEAVSAQLTASAVDVASLGEAFAGAVHDFGHSSEKMLAHLQRLDETLVRAGTRSDEQLAYYVAQAREVIDLSLLSQKQIVDDLQGLARQGAQAAPAAAAPPAAPAAAPATAPTAAFGAALGAEA